FCGGTHVCNTSELGLFKILSESSVAAGIRRIEGTTGEGVLALIAEQSRLLEDTAAAFKSNNVSELPSKARAALESLKETERELEKLENRLAGSALDEIVNKGREVKGLTVFASEIKGAKADALRSAAGELRAKYPASVCVLAAEEGGKVTLCAACGEEAIARGVKAGDVVKQTASLMGGSGGGKPELAMAGAKDASKMKEALEAAASIAEALIK
ncbi:MAG: DHHA1 domain-containing protein, partial [Oscillospiraceae bacterium]|nr:DHHA1 domain-containing protein [Oscillospiraceae bacterium]